MFDSRVPFAGTTITTGMIGKGFHLQQENKEIRGILICCILKAYPVYELSRYPPSTTSLQINLHAAGMRRLHNALLRTLSTIFMLSASMLLC